MTHVDLRGLPKVEALSKMRDALLEEAAALIRLHCAKLAAGGLAPEFVEGAEEWMREECGEAVQQQLATLLKESHVRKLH